MKYLYELCGSSPYYCFPDDIPIVSEMVCKNDKEKHIYENFICVNRKSNDKGYYMREIDGYNLQRQTKKFIDYGFSGYHVLMTAIEKHYKEYLSCFSKDEIVSMDIVPYTYSHPSGYGSPVTSTTILYMLTIHYEESN